MHILTVQKKSNILNKQKNLTLKLLFEEVITNQKEESWDPNIYHNEDNIPLHTVLHNGNQQTQHTHS